MLISDQPVGRGKVLITTPTAKETLPSERHTLKAGNITTQIARDDSKKHSYKTLHVFLAIAVVIVICLFVWLCLRKRK